ncbi:MAG TPA: succinate dehydrogenase, hydrophobic membrane anchor protein [Devosia sp.]|nr:succinate dehydrogenase, hydrophobic membrane anchor protein [Devosia sp.]
MIDRATISNPHTHYGSGRRATRLFSTQRLTGALNIAFMIFFVWFVVGLAGADRAHMLDLVRNPGVALVLCLLIVNVCVHMRIGMREVIEDYISDGPRNRLALAANDAFAILIAVLVIASVVKIVFWG